jgi:hypothetical protein
MKLKLKEILLHGSDRQGRGVLECWELVNGIEVGECKE